MRCGLSALFPKEGWTGPQRKSDRWRTRCDFTHTYHAMWCSASWYVPVHPPQLPLCCTYVPFCDGVASLYSAVLSEFYLRLLSLHAGAPDVWDDGLHLRAVGLASAP